MNIRRNDLMKILKSSYAANNLLDTVGLELGTYDTLLTPAFQLPNTNYIILFSCLKDIIL